MSAAPLLTVEVRNGADVMSARRRARELARHAGFEDQDQVRIATAVSEIARNALEHGGGGRVHFRLVEAPRAGLAVDVEDSGPGMADVSAVIEGRFRTPGGLGLGLVGSRRLMDVLEVQSTPAAGVRVHMVKYFPRGMEHRASPALTRALALTSAADAIEEQKATEGELLRALVSLGRREEELTRVNRELEETNRGMVTLYAELDEKAILLKRVSDLKTRFLSNMTHECRTPVSSMVGLAQILLDELDGPLNPEQRRQVTYIRRAGQGLAELVDDLLDLAKVESGKVTLRPTEVSAGEVLAAVRGMMRAQAAQNPGVTLVVEDPRPDVRLSTDEGKLSQILRNLIANALKFTETGEVRLTVSPCGEDRVVFTVRDTGAGISLADQARIFEEFVQVDGPMQKKFRGTGLGLPLSRSLAGHLGGSLALDSEPGRGSTFRLELPMRLGGTDRAAGATPAPERAEPVGMAVLVLQADPATRRQVSETLAGGEMRLLVAANIAEARDLIMRTRPALIVMDVELPLESAWDFLVELRQAPATRTAHIAVLTAATDEARARVSGADDFSLKPASAAWLGAQREAALRAHPVRRALVVDDDQIARFLIGGLLADCGYVVDEAGTGAEGLERARVMKPDVILLDVLMRDTNGFDVLEALRREDGTARIPVLAHTSAGLSDEDRERLRIHAVPHLPKHSEAREEVAARLREALQAAGLPVRWPTELYSDARVITSGLAPKSPVSR